MDVKWESVEEAIFGEVSSVSFLDMLMMICMVRSKIGNIMYPKLVDGFFTPDTGRGENGDGKEK